MKGKMQIFLVVLLLVPVLAMQVSAAEGSICIRTEEDCEVTVYYVAEPDGIHYRLLDSYGGGLLTFDDTLSTDLAAWLAGRTVDGIAMETEQGIAVFSDLEEGLYLVVQTKGEKGKNPFAPFLVSIPWDGYIWEVEVTPFPEETPQTGDAVLCDVFLLLFSTALLVIKAAPYQRKWHSRWVYTGQKDG